MHKDSAAIYDELLVLKAQSRDSAAFAELVQRWHARLLAHAVRLTRDADGADEAMQEVWLAIVRGIGKLKDPGAFGFWAYRIVGRECANWVHRRQRVRREGSQDGLQDAPTPQHAAPPVATDGLAEAMDALSVEHREVLALYYMQDMSIDQIAAMLEIRQGTVKSRLHYAREAMRTAITKKSNE